MSVAAERSVQRSPVQQTAAQPSAVHSTEAERPGAGGPALAVRTCLRRLESVGLSGEEVDWGVSWFGPGRLSPGRRGSEGVVQAMSGLMTVHGRDDGRPLPIALPVASVAAGLLAAQGALASLIGQARGRSARAVRTSVLQAGLLLCSHYIAAATSGQDPWPAPPAPAPGPPFRSLDGHWFEIETLDPEAWRAFWHRLGAGDADLGRAWARFRQRYFVGACSLPPGLGEAVAACGLAELRGVAASCGVSLCPLRSYDEVLGDIGPRDAHPLVLPLVGGAPEDGAPEDGTPGWPEPGRPAGDRGVAARFELARVPGGTPCGTFGMPLEGLTVVEATTRMQGPLAGLLLGMLGARVIKVEPAGGDIGRMMAPLAGDNGTFFSCWNRGKETVEVDLASSSGRRALVELVSGADAFLHNWRPGRAQEWSLGPEALARRRPGLVYVQASGWGPRPESDHLLGTDFLVQAFSGMGDGLRPHGEPPRTSRVLLADFMGALVTCEGVLAGLYLRERDGVGQVVGTSLLAGAATLQAEVLEGIRREEECGRRRGRPLWGPLEVPVATADGALVIGHLDDVALARACEVCGITFDLAVAERAVAERAVAERVGAGRAADWEERLAAAGLPAAAVRTDLAGLPGDPSLAGLFEPLGGSCWVPASPWMAPA